MTIARSATMLASGAAVLALAACGGHGGGGGANAGQPNDERALAFARCLREHGIDAPDPQTTAGGKVTQAIRVPKGIPPQRMQQIQDTCARRTGGAPKPPSPAEQAKMLDQALKFARCMRAHGVDVPDPRPSGGGIQIGGAGKTSLNPRSPAFQRAQQACQALIPIGKRDGGPSLSAGPTTLRQGQ